MIASEDTKTLLLPPSTYLSFSRSLPTFPVTLYETPDTSDFGFEPYTSREFLTFTDHYRTYRHFLEASVKSFFPTGDSLPQSRLSSFQILRLLVRYCHSTSVRLPFSSTIYRYTLVWPLQWLHYALVSVTPSFPHDSDQVPSTTDSDSRYFISGMPVTLAVPVGRQTLLTSTLPLNLLPSFRRVVFPLCMGA